MSLPSPHAFFALVFSIRAFPTISQPGTNNTREKRETNCAKVFKLQSISVLAIRDNKIHLMSVDLEIKIAVFFLPTEPLFLGFCWILLCFLAFQSSTKNRI